MELKEHKNTIYCGDALETLQKLPKESVHLIITSPPYNLNIAYNNHNDEMPYNQYLEWMGNIWKECKEVLVKGGRLCINIGENKRQNITCPTYSAFIQQCVDRDMLYRGTIIWNKNSAANHTAWGSWNSCSNPHLVPRHEYIIIFSKGDYKLEGDKKNCDLQEDGKEFMEFTRSVWTMGTESKTKIGHPAPFPLELPRRLIKFYSYRGNTVLDPFSGSGTTGVAAVSLMRNCILIDNSEEYCLLAKTRIEKEGNNLFQKNTIDIQNSVSALKYTSIDK
ncbi:MAG: site-specific DNA-methyltransferase [Chitinophagaceae bacterium]|nr:site-specific DNA-methyltransferase [Chitinophagaceae bacterium]